MSSIAADVGEEAVVVGAIMIDRPSQRNTSVTDRWRRWRDRQSVDSDKTPDGISASVDGVYDRRHL